MSDAIIIHNAKVVAPGQVLAPGWIVCIDRQIRLMGVGQPPEIFHAERIDATGLTVMPGFIDAHVHGGKGVDTMDATGGALATMATFFAEHGVTGFLATTWTESRERIEAALKTIAAAQGAQTNGATLLGAHLEGPYLNPEKCGAQSKTHIRRAERGEALSWLDMNVIKLLALAPEYEENRWLIEECVRRGITVSAAHTSATYEQMQQAVELGIRQTTHTYNAMTGLHHREPGVVGAAFTMPEINCELISDTVHVHPAAMKILYLVKGLDHIILITDAIRGAGMPDGDYPVDDRIVTIEDSIVRLPDGTLAGSTLTMNEGVRKFMQVTGVPLESVWQVSSRNAARAIGLGERKGSLEAGKDADVIIVDDDVNVYLTIAEGRVVYRSRML